MAIKIDNILKSIKDAGFSHIKIELEGQLRRQHDERYAERFIMDRLPAGVRNAVTYKKFYRDGSVDSELTLTIPTMEAKGLVDVIEAWNAYVEHNGNGCDVAGAGMHMTVMPSGTYPGARALPEAKINNFTSEVTKLLPALFIGATSGNFTRGLRYRNPQIRSQDKYSAIYTRGNTSIEYRLFETCYQRPEAVFEYLGVIARTLEYYSDPTKKVATTGEEYVIYHDSGLNGYISFSSQIKILKRQFKYIKPEGITAKEFFSHRGIKMLVSEAKEREEGKIKKLKLAYQEHKSAHDKVRQEPLSQFHIDNMEYWKLAEPNQSDNFYWEKVTGQKATIESEATYISNNLKGKKPILKKIQV